jgi:hypothetical protein
LNKTKKLRKRERESIKWQKKETKNINCRWDLKVNNILFLPLISKRSTGFVVCVYVIK